MAIYYTYYFIPCTYHLQYILELVLYQCIGGSEPYSGNVPVIVYFTHFDFLKFLFIFGCAGSSLLCGLFSHCGEQGLPSSCGVWGSHCGGFSCCGAWSLGHTGSVVVVPGPKSTHSIIMALRLSCSVTCGIIPDQGSNLCFLHWQADSLPLSHQGSPHILSNTPLNDFQYFLFFGLFLNFYTFLFF